VYSLSLTHETYHFSVRERRFINQRTARIGRRKKLKEEVWDVAHADEKDLPAMGSIISPSLNYSPEPSAIRVTTNDGYQNFPPFGWMSFHCLCFCVSAF